MGSFFLTIMFCSAIHVYTTDRFADMGIILIRPPLAEVRIPRRAAPRTHFLVINKGVGQPTVLSELRYKVAYNPNTFFLNWKQRSAEEAVEDALQYNKMYVAGV